jgi:hypothetical protein
MRMIALIQKRSRRGWWAYVIWLLIYVPSIMLFAGDTGTSVGQMWPFLIPVAILVLQLVQPTILVWAVISLPTFLYFGIFIYYAIAYKVGPQPMWDYDSQGVILGWVFFPALLGACVSLMVAAKLGAFRETRAEKRLPLHAPQRTPPEP